MHTRVRTHKAVGDGRNSVVIFILFFFFHDNSEYLVLNGQRSSEKDAARMRKTDNMAGFAYLLILECSRRFRLVEGQIARRRTNGRTTLTYKHCTDFKYLFSLRPLMKFIVKWSWKWKKKKRNEWMKLNPNTFEHMYMDYRQTIVSHHVYFFFYWALSHSESRCRINYERNKISFAAASVHGLPCSRKSTEAIKTWNLELENASAIKKKKLKLISRKTTVVIVFFNHHQKRKSKPGPPTGNCVLFLLIFLSNASGVSVTFGFIIGKWPPTHRIWLSFVLLFLYAQYKLVKLSEADRMHFCFKVKTAEHAHVHPIIVRYETYQFIFIQKYSNWIYAAGCLTFITIDVAVCMRCVF